MLQPFLECSVKVHCWPENLPWRLACLHDQVRNEKTTADIFAAGPVEQQEELQCLALRRWDRKSRPFHVHLKHCDWQERMCHRSSPPRCPHQGQSSTNPPDRLFLYLRLVFKPLTHTFSCAMPKPGLRPCIAAKNILARKSPWSCAVETFQ